MACTLTAELPLNCRDTIGGVIEFKFKILPSSATITTDYTITSGVVSIAAASRTGWFTVNQEREVASATDTAKYENGMTFTEQEIKVVLNKINSTLRNWIVLGAIQNRLHVAVSLMDGTKFLFGYQNGMDLVNATGTSGVSAGDRNGYEITLTGKENILYNWLSMSTASYDQLEVS